MLAWEAVLLAELSKLSERRFLLLLFQLLLYKFHNYELESRRFKILAKR